MEISGKYDVYFGTERGVIGNTQCKPGECAKYQLEHASKDAEITSMEWGRTSREIIIGHKNGIVRLYDTKESKFFKIPEDDLIGTGSIVGAEAVIDKIVIAKNSGHINIWTDKFHDSIKIDSDGSLDCMKHNVNRKNIIGTGGERNDFKVYDIEAKKCIFKAKSLGHDNLNLPIPTTIRGITFFECDDKLSACCTREGHLLLYDERAQRRPVSKILKPDNNFTAIASIHKEKQFVFGTSRGYLQIFDFAKPNLPIRTFPNISGGISCIVPQPYSPYMFSVSFDRFLRIHNLETGKSIHSEYLKQALTKVLIKPAVKSGEDINSEDDDKDKILIDEEYDDMFDKMEVILESGNVKKRKKKMKKVNEKKEGKKKKVDVIID
ncbi:WD repeat-containing protein 74 [Onthophagus taurus]|uniref:WD repeat-containing protein 74 n=1 Tax=Onthophagus taurus TaxID=166361 RepID=UPI0039BEC61F